MGSWKNGSLSVSLLPINFKLISETQGALTCKIGRHVLEDNVSRVSRESKTEKPEFIGSRI